MVCEKNIGVKTAYEVIGVIDKMENILGSGEWKYEETVKEFRNTAKAIALCMGYKDPNKPTGIVSACTREIGFSKESAFIRHIQSPVTRAILLNKCLKILMIDCEINQKSLGFKKFIDEIKERFEDAIGRDKKAIGILLTDENIDSLKKEYPCMIIGNCNLAKLQKKLSDAIKNNLDYLADVGKYKKDNTLGIYIRKRV